MRRLWRWCVRTWREGTVIKNENKRKQRAAEKRRQGDFS